MSILQNYSEKSQSFLNPLCKLFKKLQLKRCIARAGFKKKRGPSVNDMIIGAISSGFIAENLHVASNSSAGNLLPVCESSMYRFMEGTNGNWEQLSLNIAHESYKNIDTLNSNREKSRYCFVFDDSVLEYPKAKKMELCTWTFDHNEGCSVRGYSCLQMGWTDGESYLPLGAKLLSSDEDSESFKKTHKQKACPEAIRKAGLDKRTHASQIRTEAQERSKPDLVISWIKQAMKNGFKASYVLFDSWFNYESLLKNITPLGLKVIGMLKQDHRKYYLLNNRGHATEYRTLQSIAEKMKVNSSKRKAKKINNAILFSVTVVAATANEKVSEGIKLKLVFIRNRNNPDEFVVISSTDLTLTDEQIVKYYSRRWKIEVNFENQKQYLGLGSESISVKFDNLAAFANLSCVRASLLEFKRRIESDVRAIGALGKCISEQIREMPIAQSILILLASIKALPEILAKKKIITEDQIKAVRREISSLIRNWFSGLTCYVTEFISRWKKDLKDFIPAKTL
ncbi:MAG: transposase [Succinivibrio dextrinosolvens]|nr:transposase [Succinivibrio dextrinosolvens]